MKKILTISVILGMANASLMACGNTATTEAPDKFERVKEMARVGNKIQHDENGKIKYVLHCKANSQKVLELNTQDGCSQDMLGER